MKQSKNDFINNALQNIMIYIDLSTLRYTLRFESKVVTN